MSEQERLRRRALVCQQFAQDLSSKALSDFLLGLAAEYQERASALEQLDQTQTLPLSGQS